jgi:hypothetical protein
VVVPRKCKALSSNPSTTKKKNSAEGQSTKVKAPKVFRLLWSEWCELLGKWLKRPILRPHLLKVQNGCFKSQVVDSDLGKLANSCPQPYKQKNLIIIIQLEQAFVGSSYQ